VTGTRLAVNFSPQAAGLVASGAVTVDLFKVPDWPELVAAARRHLPVYVHFPNQIGAAREKPEVALAAELMRDTGTLNLNVHCAPSKERFPDIEVDATDAASLATVTEALAADLAPACHLFGSHNVIVENLIYRGKDRGLLRAGVAPEVLGELVDGSGCGFLLDVSHARITAATLGIDPWRYIDSLPVHALQELHITGVHVIDGGLRDHLPFQDSDWEFLDGVVARVKAGAWPAPSIVAFEYGGVGPVFEWRSDEDVLAEQLPRMRRALAALSR
jgi:hypothetical protein